MRSMLEMLGIVAAGVLQAIVIILLIVEWHRRRRNVSAWHNVVISVSDRTERRRADLGAERRLQEIAHSARAAALGELAASLAHELNQPVTAILSNAQAARNFLSAGGVKDLEEVGHAIDDIVSDDRRAGEIIRRMRTLLKRDTITRSVVFDLNESVTDVARLTSSAALLRRVSLELDLAPQLPPVRGDSVEVQQVVLNLIMNGIDATSAQPAERRIVRLETEVRDREILVHVRDRGPGVSDDHAARIFEPFFTTKAEGLGMGLAISRSIASSHGGRIWMESSPEGAAFHLALPAFVEPADCGDRRSRQTPAPVLTFVGGSKRERRRRGGSA